MNAPMHILYVDDSALDRELVRHALDAEPGAFHVTEADSRQQFEPLLAAGAFDLVLSDFHILGFEALDVLNAVKAKDPRLPVVIVTGTGSEELAVEAMKRGAADYVIKNERHLRRLPDTLRHVLRQRELERAAAQAQAEAAAAHRQLAQILERVSDAFVALDKDWRYTYVNPQAGALFGRRPEDLIGKHIWTEFPEAVGQPFHRAYEKAMAEQVFIQIEEFYPPYDRWFENRIYPSPEGLAIFFHDITGGKQAEAERDRLFNHSLDLLCVGGFDGYFRQLNPAWQETLGWTVEELKAKPWLEFVHPDDRAATVRAGEQLTRGEAVRGFENRYQCKDGSYRWLSWNCFPLAEARASFAVVRDVTGLKQADAALRESEARFRQLFAASPDALFLLDSAGRFLDCNEVAAQRYGYSRAELLQMTARELAAPDLKDQAAPQVQRALETGGTFEWRHRRKDGTELPVEISAKPFQLGGQTCILSSVRDITERKQAEAALRASEARLRAIFDTEPECVKLLAADGTLLEMNPAGLRMLEADSVRQVDRLCIYPLVVEEHRPAFRQLVEKVFQGESGALEFHVVGLKGGRRWLETHASPLRDAAGKITALLGITRDITERRRAETALAASEHKYRSLTENLRQLVYRADPQTLVATFVNQAVETLYGYTVDEWLADPALWERTIHPQDRERVLKSFREAQQRKEDGAIEYRIVRKDGAERSVVDEFRWERDENDGAIALNGVRSDITERKRAEEALRESEVRLRKVHDRLERIVATAPGIVCSFRLRPDGSACFPYGGKRLAEVYGIPSADLEEDAAPFFALVHPDDLGGCGRRLRSPRVT